MRMLRRLPCAGPAVLAFGVVAAVQAAPPAQQPGAGGRAAPPGTDLSVPVAERGIGAASPTRAQERTEQPPALPLPGAPPPPSARRSSATCAITLGARHACVTPQNRNRARADGGVIEVLTPSPGALTVRMTGAPAADSYLGCTSSASQTFRLVQEFEVRCSDASVEAVALTLDSSLVGYVRSRRRADAGMRLARASVLPEGWTDTPLVLAHPPMCVSGDQARLCNQHLPPLEGPPMPLGRYVLVADFVLDTTASGICNAHAAVDFSPDTALPVDWVRTRDPFQGASKKSFGFTLTLTAAPSEAGPPSSALLPAESSLRRAAFEQPDARGPRTAPPPNGSQPRRPATEPNGLESTRRP